MYLVRDIPKIDTELFNSKIEKTESCWLWAGGKYQNGYGKFGNRGYMVHRISYEMAKGKIPQGMKLDHLCRVRHCVNPDHLEPVTLVENVMRGESIWAKNARKTHCKHGHEFTKENTHIHPQRNRRHCKQCAKIADRVRQERSRGK